MPRISAGGLSFHYQQVGAGPDIVLIHGMTGDLSPWYIGVMPRLASSFRVTAYDLRGHGHTDAPPTGYTTADHGADLRALLDALGIERAHLVGHSFGAAVAMHTAVLAPDRVASLLLFDPGVPALFPEIQAGSWSHMPAALAALEAAEGAGPMAERWIDVTDIVKQPVGLQRRVDRNARRLSRLRHETTAFADALQPAGLTADVVATIAHPTLVVFGARSLLRQTAAHFERLLRGRTVTVEVDTLSHFFALTRPDFIVETVADFVSELERQPVTGGTTR